MRLAGSLFDEIANKPSVLRVLFLKDNNYFITYLFCFKFFFL